MGHNCCFLLSNGSSTAVGTVYGRQPLLALSSGGGGDANRSRASVFVSVELFHFVFDTAVGFFFYCFLFMANFAFLLIDIHSKSFLAKGIIDKWIRIIRIKQRTAILFFRNRWRAALRKRKWCNSFRSSLPVWRAFHGNHCWSCESVLICGIEFILGIWLLVVVSLEFLRKMKDKVNCKGLNFIGKHHVNAKMGLFRRFSLNLSEDHLQDVQI
jgi:hypothetical protein